MVHFTKTTVSFASAALRAGRAIVWHRDHGSRNGWAEPSFGISHVGALDNGDVDPADAYEDRLPVVFSTNCSSGRFDDDPLESFAEKLLRESDGGAVAVVAASRNSSTSRNQVLSRLTRTSGRTSVGCDRDRAR